MFWGIGAPKAYLIETSKLHNRLWVYSSGESENGPSGIKKKKKLQPFDMDLPIMLLTLAWTSDQTCKT